jgi:hypothetical protein
MTDPVLGTARESMVTASSSGTKNPAIIVGTDAYLGTITGISDADYKPVDLLQAKPLKGTDAKVSLPTSITDLNDN